MLRNWVVLSMVDIPFRLNFPVFPCIYFDTFKNFIYFAIVKNVIIENEYTNLKKEDY